MFNKKLSDIYELRKELKKLQNQKETYNNKTDFFANEYNDKDWKKYSECFPETDITVNGVSQDVVNAIVVLLGKKYGVEWLHIPLTAVDGKTAVELEQTEKGRKALRAFIMRMPC
ncbi:MAG: MbcA/ParS/Xre antitoxin family protein [Ruminococcus sp.]|nr:MbcA/ParS/Xre antitoxin family protein [Ruminococcus sp.]